jgi:hypothetical protein
MRADISTLHKQGILILRRQIPQFRSRDSTVKQFYKQLSSNCQAILLDFL